jgi:hypothetical protein
VTADPAVAAWEEAVPDVEVLAGLTEHAPDVYVWTGEARFADNVVATPSWRPT